MNYSDLEANAIDIRSGNSEELKKYTDNELIELHKDVSKSIMYIDLQAALNVDINDNETIDKVVNRYTERLQKALAYKQLCFFYQELNGGEGSKADIRFKNYVSMYNTIKSTFSQMKSDIITPIMSKSVWL